MDIFKRIEMEIKQKRQERLDAEDYTRTMEREYKRMEEQAKKEQQEYEEYLLAYERDSAKFGF